MLRQVDTCCSIGTTDLLGYSCTSGHRIAVVTFRSSKLERNSTANTPNCYTALNNPACHLFLSTLAMEGSQSSSSSALSGLSHVSLLSIVICERSSDKLGSSLSFRNVLNVLMIFILSGL